MNPKPNAKSRPTVLPPKHSAMPPSDSQLGVNPGGKPTLMPFAKTVCQPLTSREKRPLKGRGFVNPVENLKTHLGLPADPPRDSERALPPKNELPKSKTGFQTHRENIPPSLTALGRASVGPPKIPFPRLKNDRFRHIQTSIAEMNGVDGGTSGRFLDADAAPSQEGCLPPGSAFHDPIASLQSTLSKIPQQKPSCEIALDIPTNDSLGETPYPGQAEGRYPMTSVFSRTVDSLDPLGSGLSTASLPAPADAAPAKSHLLTILKWLNETQNRYGEAGQSCSGDPHTRLTRPNQGVEFIVKMVQRTALKERVQFLAIDLFHMAQRREELRHHEPTLLGLTVIWMSAKFEDAWAPHTNGFFKLNSVAELKHKMALLEAQILAALNFNVNLVLVYDYLNLFAAVGRLPARVRDFGVRALTSLLTHEDFHCCDKQLVGMALAMAAVKAFSLQPFWRERVAANGRRLLGVSVQCGLNRTGDAVVPPQVVGAAQDPKPDLLFDLNDLEHLQIRLEELIDTADPGSRTARLAHVKFSG